jgi:hypothetical protein
MTAAEALMLRSQALNKRYGLDTQKAAAVTSQPTNSTRGFAWGAFGIGAAVMFGLALLAGGFFVRHRLLATRRGLTPIGRPERLVPSGDDTVTTVRKETVISQSVVRPPMCRAPARRTFGRGRATPAQRPTNEQKGVT